MASICRRKIITIMGNLGVMFQGRNPPPIGRVYFHIRLAGEHVDVAKFGWILFDDLCVNDQNAKFHRVGQNALWNRRRLWDRAHLVCKVCTGTGSFIGKKLFSTVSSSFRVCSKIFAFKSRPVIMKPRQNRQFGGQSFRGEGWAPKYCTSIFKSGSLPNMWQSLIEFRCGDMTASVNKEGTWAKYNGFPCMRQGRLWKPMITLNPYDITQQTKVMLWYWLFTGRTWPVWQWLRQLWAHWTSRSQLYHTKYKLGLW